MLLMDYAAYYLRASLLRRYYVDISPTSFATERYYATRVICRWRD